MKITRSATFLAKLISWVTQSIVLPDAANSPITLRTSLIISGSSAEVGSSNIISLGFIARARAMATRCCWPPESWPGVFLRLFRYTYAAQQLERELLRLLLRHMADLLRRECYVAHDGEVREEVELLKDHPRVGPYLGESAGVVRQLDAVNDDPGRNRVARADLWS